VVGIDPGKSDLVYCIANDEEEIKKFRYTQNQRRKETKQKKYRDICDGLKSSTKVDGKTIKEWEAELSSFNRKTLSFEAFKVYAAKKNDLNCKLLTFYQQRLFRKFKWNAFMNKKRSEAHMTNRFKEIFGSPQDVVIGFGDWEQRKHMKFKEPTKGKGFRTLLRKAGYQVYLVDEYRTSCRCHYCQSHEGVCEKFRECKNTRPWKRDETILRHGLLRCKTCERLWNRDVNGSLNIHKVVVDTIAMIGRPAYLSRISAAASVAHNHILDEDEKPQL
jgi:transposase